MGSYSGDTTMKNDSKYNKLTAEEERVIIHKGTEAPFTGKYNKHYEKGSYYCKRCDAELYKSDDKFSSNCGWPSFDDEVKGAVKRITDADGRRTEILCNNCGGHLGHVFEGEGFTKKNVRHCVNSISLNFVAEKDKPKTAKAYFAGGCFWGVEHLFEHKEGVISAVSGYMGGRTEKPTYKDVCYKNTGHIEAVEITYDSKKVDFETLARFFFEIHDPTQKNGQGPDIGEQYKSAVFYNSEEEKKITEKLVKILKDKGYDVVTELLPAAKFWKAEEYHQDYYDKKKSKPYCHVYGKKF
ncbi:MAG: bifunctional methionine sulfoxide reductase B/A protein [Planctomycetota bacterium]